MFYTLNILLQVIDTQKVYMYYVPRRHVNLNNDGRHNQLMFLLARPPLRIPIMNQNKVKDTLHKTNRFQTNYRGRNFDYHKRNRTYQTFLNRSMSQNSYIPPHKNVILDTQINEQAVQNQNQTPVPLSEEAKYIDRKFSYKNGNTEVYNGDDSETTMLQSSDKNSFNNLNEDIDESKVIINKNGKIRDFYRKNKYLILFEIFLLTVLCILLIARFEIYLLPIKLYRRYFKNRTNVRVHHEPMPAEDSDNMKNKP